MIAIVLGTRPEIIKLSPIIRLAEKRKRRFVLIHTGQHYSFEMDRVFFRQLRLPAPTYQLSIRSLSGGRHGEHAGRIMDRIEDVLLQVKPRVVLVQGDTNTVLAASLAAAKIQGIAIGHVEAGLRSFDRDMPEEINRIVSDHVAHYLFAPTHGARHLLRSEGIPANKIYVTGNTIVDAVRTNARLAAGQAIGRSRSKKGKFFLLTLHRQENVDDRMRLTSIFRGLKQVLDEHHTPILFPAHPRTLMRLKTFGLPLPPGVRVTPPAGFLEFLSLEKNAQLILTDSGGVQEEACILGVPCVTLRTTTERPETLEIGANRLAGYDSSKIVGACRDALRKRAVWRNPFGDGKASERILSVI